MKHLVSGIVAVALALGVPFTARSQSEITLLAPNPIEATINKLVADFEKKTGTHVMVTYGTGSRGRPLQRSGFRCLAVVRACFQALKTGNIVPAARSSSRDFASPSG